MHVAAAVAQLCSQETLLDATCRHYDGRDAMLSPFVVERVAWAKFDESEESWPVDRLCLVTGCDKGANRKPGEVVAGQEAFICKIAVDIKFRFGHPAFI